MNGVRKMNVNTDGIGNVRDFGLSVFEGYRPALKRWPVEVVFTGKKRAIQLSFLESKPAEESVVNVPLETRPPAGREIQAQLLKRGTYSSRNM